MDELKKKANGQPSNIAGDVKLGKKIVDALTSGNYFSAIAKGLKFIFGSTTTRPEVSKVSLTTTGVVTMGELRNLVRMIMWNHYFQLICMI